MMDQYTTFKRSNRLTTPVLTGIVIFLLLLWIPVVIDKWLHFESFKAGMINQPLPKGLKEVLVYTLPAAESLTVLLLINEKTRYLGLWLSFVLLLLFTGYVGLALLGAWEKLPCSCGSVIKHLTWKQHFLFNCSFLILSAYGLKKHKKQSVPLQ